FDQTPEVEPFSKTPQGDVLRGKKIPITRLTPESLARAKSRTKKVETLLKKTKSDSLISLRNDPYENIMIEELGTSMLLRDYDDSADISSHPSYNIMKFRDLNCYVKYLDSKEKYDKQFMREMKHLIQSQTNICDEYFLKKILCYKTLWPPLHTKRELNFFVRKFFQLPPRAKARVEYLMKTDLSLGN
ncbi:hypothetical protein KR067_000285, partial [Drosophila pandora]